MRIIDADGHVMDGYHMDDIARYMPAGHQRAQIFPALDHLHLYWLGSNRVRLADPDAGEWIEFMDDVGIDWSVVYPTAGLAVGRLASRDWAVAACRAYNDWLYDRYLKVGPRLKGMALIPVQDPEAAAAELERAVTQLGMVGGMLPSNGEGIKGHFGDRIYWPLYAEAERLGCPLALHGGCHHNFGMDGFSAFYPVLALGHPFSIMTQAAAMMAHGVFDQFPGLRVGFLEGGATWVPFFLDRMERSYRGHLQVDLEGGFIAGPQPEEGTSDYFQRLVTEGRIFVGFDCDDKGLGYAVQRVGPQPFLFASDFPHESFNATSCRHEIEELARREDLTEQQKQAVLADNAERFYG
jgi:predicted TIM-barrel fold metal-dependent hydrolase